MVEITADLVLRAYAAGVFPMSEDGDDERVFWVDPKQRGVMPLSEFHLPRRLRRTVKSGQFKITINCCFDQVMAACAASTPAPTPAPDRISEIPPGPGRAGTWINRPLMDLFCELHDMGFAHSVEVLQDDELVGGLYGVSLGAAFFGESMFSRRRDASKVAMVHLVGRLITAGYQLLDTQFVTDHLRQFGTREISRETYHRLLNSALGKEADFTIGGRDLDVAHILQSITQTS